MKNNKLGSKATVSKTYLILKLLLMWSNIHLAPVVRKADNAIHRTDHYPVKRCFYTYSSVVDPDLLIRGTKNNGGRVGLHWIHHCLFLISVHFTHGIISHHTRNNRPFQRGVFFFFFFFILWNKQVRRNPSTPKIGLLKVAWFCRRLYGEPHHRNFWIFATLLSCIFARLGRITFKLGNFTNFKRSFY